MVQMSTKGSQKTTFISILGVIINHPNGTYVYKGVPKDLSILILGVIINHPRYVCLHGCTERLIYINTRC